MADFTIINLPGPAGKLLWAQLYSPVVGAVVVEQAVPETGTLTGLYTATVPFSGVPNLTDPFTYAVRVVDVLSTAGFNAATSADHQIVAGFYGYLTGSGFSPASDPAQTTAGLVTRSGRGNAQPNVQVDFQLVDPSPSGSGTDAYDMRTFSACSDVAGVLSTTLQRSTKYRARRGKGPWVTFTTTDTTTYALPELLGDAPQG